MALWRPPRSINERSIRAIRSMQNGSMDGRVVSAFPVKGSGLFDESDFEGEDLITEEEDGPRLLPYTDYFEMTETSTKTFQLTFVPWDQEFMADSVENRASVHIYWNGVFQRDLSYTLNGVLLTIADTDKVIRSGDTLTVKYFYEEGTEPGGAGDGLQQIFRMQCWLDDMDHYEPGFGYSVRAAGPIGTPPPVGQNGGTVTMMAHRYTNVQFLAGWRMRFRLPTGLLIPLDNVDSMEWRIEYDRGATVNYIDYATFSAQGSNYGSIVGRTANCGIGADCLPESMCPPSGLFMGALPNVGLIPAPGPEGGELFADGQEAIDLAEIMNITNSDGTHKSARVGLQHPRYIGGTTYNSGCRGPGGVNFDDTIWGRDSYELATFYCRIGITCYVTLSS